MNIAFSKEQSTANYPSISGGKAVMPDRAGSGQWGWWDIWMRSSEGQRSGRSPHAPAQPAWPPQIRQSAPTGPPQSKRPSAPVAGLEVPCNASRQSSDSTSSRCPIPATRSAIRSQEWPRGRCRATWGAMDSADAGPCASRCRCRSRRSPSIVHYLPETGREPRPDVIPRPPWRCRPAGATCGPAAIQPTSAPQ